MTEEWRAVPGLDDGYQVSDHGRIRSISRVITDRCARSRTFTGRVLKPWTHKSGYQMVRLREKSEYIHRLVAAAFLPVPDPSLIWVCHKDGDPSNNAVSNLEWGTASDNMRDQVRHGRHPWASKTHCPKGHEYTPENTTVYARKNRQTAFRQCRRCNRERRGAQVQARRKLDYEWDQNPEAMSIEWIRDHYSVPAKRGARIRFNDKPGRITSAYCGYLMVHLDGEPKGRRHYVHPTWRMEYGGDA